MATFNKQFRASGHLNHAIALRWVALGYKTEADYFRGLARYDLLVQGEHKITKEWTDLPAAEQDAIDQVLNELAECGISVRGDLLSRIVERVLTKEQPVFEALMEEARSVSLSLQTCLTMPL